jgi:hypothetical protein
VPRLTLAAYLKFWCFVSYSVSVWLLFKKEVRAASSHVPLIALTLHIAEGACERLGHQHQGGVQADLDHLQNATCVASFTHCASSFILQIYNP